MNFIKNNYKKLIIALVLISLLGFGIKTISAQKESTSGNTKFDAKNDLVITAKKQGIKEEITLAGSVDAANKTDLRFQTSGQLAWVGVKVGDRVKKWQSIASLNREELKKRLQIDFNNYKTSLSNFDDTQDKYKTQKENLTLTDEMKRILSRSQNSLDNSVINYELTELSMRYSTLTTPIAGVVTNVDQPSSGINVTPANATFSIIDPQSIYLKSEIDQEDVTKIKVGQKATLKLDSFPDKTIDSKITYISFTPVQGQSSTVYEVRFELPKDNDDLKYKLGMDGDITIVLSESDNTLTVPTDAIKDDGNQKYVFVKTDNNQLVKKNIKTGIETDNDTEILEGLSENDQVVIKQQ